MKNLLLLFLFLSSSFAAEHSWIRAGLNTNAPLWGLEGGLQFALHPAGFSGGDGGPRGLIRIGFPTLTNSAYDLINFIAVEPIVAGRKGFSELERSAFDGKQGKLFWTGALNRPATNAPHLDPGKITTHPEGVEELSIIVLMFTGSDASVFKQHLEDQDAAALSSLLELAWLAAPDNGSIHGIPGWGILCDLCSESHVLFSDNETQMHSN